MASQSPFFSSPIPIINNNKTHSFSPQPNNYHFLTFKNTKIPSSKTEPSSLNSQEPGNDKNNNPIKLEFAKESSFIERIEGSKSDNQPKDASADKEIPLALRLAMEKAKEYKKNKGVVGSEATSSSSSKISQFDKKNDVVQKKEVPFAVDTSETAALGLMGGNGRSVEEKKPVKKDGKKEDRPISSIDFVGLSFSDKKSKRSVPAGLVPVYDPYPEDDFPEVEILVGDASKFGNVAPSSNPASPTDDDTELYKPKVTTWGVFPRPNDISKAYGGGRTLRPGEALETPEEKADKQEKTKKMVAAYKSKIARLNVDPKLKSECEKALTEGDTLMDRGYLKQALPFYEEVMEKLVFESELYGLAALQWSICLDSLSRSSEARVMYEKLKSHPNAKVSKRARQFYSSFEAMEFLKVTTSSPRDPFTGYQTYFDAFVGEKTNISLQDDETDEATLSQTLPYVFFLVSPILMVVLIAYLRSK